MASPMTTGGQPGYGWSPAPTNQPPMGSSYQGEAEEMAVQVRPMALKVHYTFDKDSRVNCLARWPQNLQVQTVPLDERTWIGIVDIRVCIQAIAQGSPELLAQNELDYAIYATDFSEPDTPLVGQGMMSWVMDPSSQPGASSHMVDDTPKMVTGRVTKNMLGLFGNGARETLEVRLKLSESPRAGRVGSSANGAINMANGNMNQTGMANNNSNNNSNNGTMNDGMAVSYNGRAGSNAPTPTDTTEWNSFMQSNPGLGRSASISTMYQSPNMMPARPDFSGFPPATQPTGMGGQGYSLDAGAHPMPLPTSRPASQAASRPNSRQSIGPIARSGFVLIAKAGTAGSPPLPTPLSQPSPYMGNYDPSLTAASTPPVDATQAPARPPRTRPPRSRATGRPRGRPKKRPAADGNTSAAEDLPTDNDAQEVSETNEAIAASVASAANAANEANQAHDANDGEDAHKKKRVKTTKVDYPTRTSLDLAPDSLRVAASTNGSLRTLRPVIAEPNSAADGYVAGAHLQEFPRAPTPVPQGVNGRLGQQQARKIVAQKAQRESLADFESGAIPDQSSTRSLGAHSPTESLAPSPDNYTPEDSPADIGSSPPVPRTTSYVPQSSPMPSSPPLPPMRRAQPDSGFMSGGAEGLFDDDDCMTEKDHQPPTPLEATAPTPDMHFALPLPQSEAANAAPSPPVSQSQHAPSPTYSQPQPAAAPRTDSVTQQPQPGQPQPEQPQVTKGQSAPLPPAAATSTQTATRPTKATKRTNKTGGEQFEFKSMEPGPPELLPTTMLYNPPPPPPKSRNKNQRASSMVAKANPPSLERCNSEPSRNVQQQSQSTQPSQPPQRLPFLLPSGSTTARLDVPDDMQELAKLLAASADNDQDAVSLINIANIANEPSKSPTHPQPVLPQQPAAEVARMARGLPSFLPLPRATAVPASDPPALPPLTLPTLPLPPVAHSEAPCPPSDIDMPSGRSKNLVRKAAIKERLQKAIESGQMPTFCQNCGAIETPTWRKMWTQDRDGEPEEYEFSEKPGHVTAVDILERDEDGKVNKYRLVKKSLSNTDDGKLWTPMFLCNPCGIWLGKCKSHRPSDRWDRDASRLTQPKGRKSRSRKSRAKSDNQQPQPTSEAYFTTDPAGPNDHEDGLAPSAQITQMPLPAAPATAVALPASSTQSAQIQTEPTTEPTAVDSRPKQAVFQAGSNQEPASTGGSASHRGPGSAHAKGSGSVKSPIAVDDSFGTTRRLLFPSPRKEGVLKVLGELAVNVIGSVLGSPKPNKDSSGRFEAAGQAGGKQRADEHDLSVVAADDEQDDMVDLFGTPPPKGSLATARPSTPPPRSGGEYSPNFASGPFKTPTRPTPSHRPITRSVSKTIRSGVSSASFPTSPMLDGGQAIQRTPSKTPRSVHVGSTTRQQQRRLAAATPGRSNTLQLSQQDSGSSMQLDHAPLNLESLRFDTPFTSTLNKLLSEANDFTTGSPSHGLTELDLASLANLDSDGLAADFSSSAGIDFGSYLDANLDMASSSPLAAEKGLHRHLHENSGQADAGLPMFTESMWSDFNDAMMKEDGKK